MSPAGGFGRNEASGLARAAPLLALGLFGVSWSAVLVRLTPAPATAIAFWRLAFSVLLLAPFAVGGDTLRQWRRLTAADWTAVGGSGLCLALHLVLWFESLELTSVASSTVLVSTHPIFVGLLSAVWLDEAPGRREWAGILLAVGGAAVVGWGDLRGGAAPLRGDLLALAAAAMAAVYFAVGRRLRARLGLQAYVIPVYAAAALATAASLGSGAGSFTGYPAYAWLLFLALAVGPMLLGHTSFNWSLRHVRAYVVSLVMLLEPVGATLLAILLLGSAEVPGPEVLAGGLVVLVGVAVSLRARARERARHGGGAPRGGTPGGGGEDAAVGEVRDARGGREA